MIALQTALSPVSAPVLPAPVLPALMKGTRPVYQEGLKRVPAAVTAFYEGDQGADLFEVMEGVVKLYKMTADGRCQITGFAYPGHFIGLSQNDTYCYTAEAITGVTLKRYARRALETSPELATRLFVLLRDELAAAQDQMLLLGRKTATERLASFLVRLADYQKSDTIHLPMKRVEIADFLGLTIETVSRTFTRLCKAGVLKLVDRTEVEICREDLEDLAAGVNAADD